MPRDRWNQADSLEVGAIPSGEYLIRKVYRVVLDVRDQEDCVADIRASSWLAFSAHE